MKNCPEQQLCTTLIEGKIIEILERFLSGLGKSKDIILLSAGIHAASPLRS